MSGKDPKHPTLDNEITINLPLDRQVSIRDTLGCREGIHNRIHVKSRNEDYLIESTVDPMGNNDLKVFKNNQLIKHVFNGVNKLDEQKELTTDPKANTSQQNNDKKQQNSDNNKKP